MQSMMIIAALFFLYGIVIGSFLNVCIYRIPKEISIAKGRSFCPSCSHALNPVDLVPVLSYLFLKGKCRYCGAKITPKYLTVELLTGFLFLLVFLRFSLSMETIVYCFLTCCLIILSFIDLDIQEIPDRFHVIVLLLGIIQLIFVHNAPWYLYILGIFIVSAPMLIIAYFTDGFGGGDIKLIASAGFLLGAYHIALAFFIGAFLGGMYGIYLILFKEANRKSAFAFGPFLSVGILIAGLYGTTIIEYYVESFL